MTIFNIRRMSESFEVEGGGTVAAVGSTYASAVGLPEVERGGGGAPEEEESTLGHSKLAHI